MYIRIDDGVTIYASFFVHVSLDDNLKKELMMFQIESDGIIMYPNDDLNFLKNKLDNLNLTYTVEELLFDQQLLDKSQNVKYSSRTEAIEHLLNDQEPESQVIPNIKKDNNIIGSDIVDKDLKILSLENENSILGSSLVSLELEILSLRGD
jgi:hypothetical protein